MFSITYILLFYAFKIHMLRIIICTHFVYIKRAYLVKTMFLLLNEISLGRINFQEPSSSL